MADFSRFSSCTVFLPVAVLLLTGRLHGTYNDTIRFRRANAECKRKNERKKEPMKRMSNHLALALTLVMLLTMLAGVQVSAAPAQEGTVVAQTVTYEDVTAEIFRYTPEDFEFRGNNTPLLFVLSDTTFTAETAAQMLNTKGFKTIADEESCSVLFVSPKNGESWTEDDYKALQILAGNATDDFYIGTDYSAGID